MKTVIVKMTYVSLILFSIISCSFFDDDLPDTITNEVIGRYLYKYSSGQVEELNLNRDSTYEQLFYLNENNYLKSSEPMFKNKSNWSVHGKNIRFENWLMCSDFGLNFDTIKNRHMLLSFSNVHWRKPSKNRKEYKLYFYYENGYVYAKQTEPKPLYHIHNTP